MKKEVPIGLKAHFATITDDTRVMLFIVRNIQILSVRGIQGL
jgi:hypothetical protein